MMGLYADGRYTGLATCALDLEEYPGCRVHLSEVVDCPYCPMEYRLELRGGDQWVRVSIDGEWRRLEAAIPCAHFVRVSQTWKGDGSKSVSIVFCPTVMVEIPL